MARPACRSAGFVCPPNLLGYLCSSPCPTACADHRRLRQVKYLLSSSSSSAEKKGKTVALISAACMPACMAVYLSARLITWPLAWPSAFPYLHIPSTLSHSPPLLLTRTSSYRPPYMFSHTYLLLLLLPPSSSCHTSLPICPHPSPLPSRPYPNFTTLNYTSSPTTHLCPPPFPATGEDTPPGRARPVRDVDTSITLLRR